MRTSPRLRIAAACVLSSLAAITATAPAEAARTDCTIESGWPAQDAALALEVVQRVNAYRQSQGLSTLQISQSLTNAAAWKASQLAFDGPAGFDHSDYITGRRPEQRIQQCGYGYGFGENIALGQSTAERVMTAWLNSPGHKRNLDHPGWQAIGVGAATGGSYGIGWAQIFGTQIPDPVPTPTANLVPPATTTPSTAVPLPTPTVETPPPAAPAAAPAAVANAPGITIMERPRSRTRRRTVRVSWTISGVAHAVSCSLNGRALPGCTPTGRTLRNIRLGRHAFRVTVAGPSGTDTQLIRWRVLRRR